MSILYRAKTNIRYNKKRFVEGDVIPDLTEAAAAQLLRSDSIIALPPAALPTPEQRAAFNQMVTEVVKAPGTVRAADPGEAGRPEAPYDPRAPLTLNENFLPTATPPGASDSAAPATAAATGIPDAPAVPPAAKPKATAAKAKTAKTAAPAKGTKKAAAAEKKGAAAA